MKQLYINNTLISDDDIIEYPKVSEEISFEESNVMPDTMECTLDNTDRNKYDDRFPGSMFYHGAGINKEIKVWDTDYNKFIFKGKIKDIRIQETDNGLKIEATSQLGDLSAIDCTYSATAIKPALAIYEILTEVAGISPENIVYAGFQKAINARNILVDILYTEDNVQDCLTIINELQRIGHCMIYPYQSMILMYSYEPYNGEIGETIKDILPKTYIQYYSIDTPFKIYNKYRIAYNNGTTVAIATGQDATSVTNFGERSFNVPDDDVDSTDPVDFNTLVNGVTSADIVGAVALQRFKNIMQLCEFTVDYKYLYIRVGQQVDLRFYPFNGEPCLVLERQVNDNNKTIKLKCLFLNLPTVIYARDTTPPNPPELVAVIPVNGGYLLKWSKNESADHLGYKIYFTTTKGEWNSEYSNLGQSPIDVKPDAYTFDGYLYQYISQLHLGTTYHFKITAYDSNFNESDFSNVISTNTTLDITELNQYKVHGDILINSLTIDKTNSLKGVILGSWGAFPYTLPFNLNPGCVYTSGIYHKPEGLTYLIFTALGNTGFQYRFSYDGVVWSEWSTEVSVSGTNTLTLDNIPYFQYRFILSPITWLDNNYIFIRNII